MNKLVDRIIDTRVDFYSFGVDYGCDASVLAIKGLYRLVWTKSSTYNSMPGCHGGGCVNYVSTQLTIRRFTLDKTGRPRPDVGPRKDDLFSGGRLSKTRLLTVSDWIDAEFGDGITARLDPLKTLVIGEDVIGDWFASERAKPRHVSPESRAMFEFRGDYNGLKL